MPKPHSQEILVQILALTEAIHIFKSCPGDADVHQTLRTVFLRGVISNVSISVEIYPRPLSSAVLSSVLLS